MLSLVAAALLAAPPAFDVLTVPRPAEGTHLKYLINGQRVGTSFDRLELGTFERKPAMVWTNDMDLRMTAGKKKITRFVSDTSTGTDRRITVKDSRSTATYDQHGALINGTSGAIEILPRVEGDDAPESTFDTSAVGIRLYLPIPNGVAPAHCIALKSVPLAGGIKVEVE